MESRGFKFKYHTPTVPRREEFRSRSSKKLTCIPRTGAAAWDPQREPSCPWHRMAQSGALPDREMTRRPIELWSSGHNRQGAGSRGLRPTLNVSLHIALPGPLARHSLHPSQPAERDIMVRNPNLLYISY